MLLRCATSICLAVLSATPGWGQDNEDPLHDFLAEERIRARVESAFVAVGKARLQYVDDTAFVEAYTDIAYDLGNADPAVIPLLANEAVQANPDTFYLAAYALGLQGTPEAVRGLIDAIERADDEQTAWAEQRKAHLVWALAVAGDVRANRIADEGRHSVGDKGVHRMISVLETATILTAPESLAILHEELSADDLVPPEDRRRTLYSLRALGRVGHPSSLPVLVKLTKNEDQLIRMEAAKALASYPQEAAVEALFEALLDSSESVSAFAANALALQRPENGFERVSELLDRVSGQSARKALYKLLVRLDPEAAIPLLAGRIGHRDPLERLALYEAAAMIRSAEVLDLLVHGLADPDNAVGITVVRTLAAIDHPRARRLLLRAIDSPRWPLAQSAARFAAEARVEGAAGVIRKRLLSVELPQLVDVSSEKYRAEWLLDLSVALVDVEALDGLEKALEVQKDGLLLKRIEVAVRQLGAAREAGKDFGKWEALAFDEDLALRETAYRHLSMSAKPERAAAVLTTAFGRVDPAEAVLIVDMLAHLDTPATHEFIERLLTSLQYQRPELYAVRDMAAWTARRLGGARMREALKRSIEIRQGRDIRPIVYYALLAGDAAVGLIEETVATRMRFSAITRGNEHLHLRKLLNALRFGHAIDDSDRSPVELRFM